MMNNNRRTQHTQKPKLQTFVGLHSPYLLVPREGELVNLILNFKLHVHFMNVSDLSTIPSVCSIISLLSHPIFKILTNTLCSINTSCFCPCSNLGAIMSSLSMVNLLLSLITAWLVDYSWVRSPANCWNCWSQVQIPKPWTCVGPGGLSSPLPIQKRLHDHMNVPCWYGVCVELMASINSNFYHPLRYLAPSSVRVEEETLFLFVSFLFFFSLSFSFLFYSIRFFLIFLSASTTCTEGVIIYIILWDVSYTFRAVCVRRGSTLLDGWTTQFAKKRSTFKVFPTCFWHKWMLTPKVSEILIQSHWVYDCMCWLGILSGHCIIYSIKNIRT